MTVAESHSVVGDAMGAASVHVGMTRGRRFNRVYIVAADAGEARAQFVLASERERADRGLARATTAARESVRGLARRTEERHKTTHGLGEIGFSRGTEPGWMREAGLGR